MLEMVKEESSKVTLCLEICFYPDCWFLKIIAIFETSIAKAAHRNIYDGAFLQK